MIIMTTLKDLTKESHTRAEKCLFVKKLLKKQLTPYQYYVYLSNQASMYWFLESYATEQGIFDDIEEMKRSEHILDDLKNMEQEYGFKHPLHTKTTERYLSYIRSISADKQKLLAHVYVRHLGDLSGGQIIKRFVPVAYTKHYDFDGDTEEIKARFKERTSLELVPEANKCFDFMIDFFHDLEVQFEF
jgi:heme oxygenase (biliverdin-producing, ferredoxin)